MNRRTNLTFCTAAVLLTFGTGCAGSGAATSDSTPVSNSAAADHSTVTSTAPDEPVAGAASGPPTTVTTVGPVSMIDGVELLVLDRPAADTAEQAPEFSWAPVAGTTTYRLAVLDTGVPIWSWTGADTHVRLGGFSEERPVGFPGPSIGESTTWSVVAIDENGTVLAASEMRPLTSSEP